MGARGAHTDPTGPRAACQACPSPAGGGRGQAPARGLPAPGAPRPGDPPPAHPGVAARLSPGLDSAGRGTGRGPHAMVCPGTSPSPWGGALCPGHRISAATTSSLNPSARTRPPTQGPAPPPRTHPGQTPRSGRGSWTQIPENQARVQLGINSSRSGVRDSPTHPAPARPGLRSQVSIPPPLLRTQTSCAPSPNHGVRGLGSPRTLEFRPPAPRGPRCSPCPRASRRRSPPAGPPPPYLAAGRAPGAAWDRPGGAAGRPHRPRGGPGGRGLWLSARAPTAASQTWRRGASAEGGAGPDRAPPTEPRPLVSPAPAPPALPGWGLPAMGGSAPSHLNENPESVGGTP